MTGIFRVKGLLALLLFVLLAALFWFVLADWLLKRAIVDGGEAMSGARVELSSADLGLIPLGVTLRGMAVADADQPMRNLFEFDEARAHIDFYKLLLGYLVIKDLSIDGLRMGSERRVSGALAKKKQPSSPPATSAPAAPITESDTGETASVQTARVTDEKTSDSASGLPDMPLLPDVQTILDREPLLIDQRSRILATSAGEERQRIDRLVSELPDTRAIEQMQARLERITKGKVTSLDDFRKRQRELEALKKEITASRKSITAAQKQLALSTKVLEDHVTSLRAAPAEDLARIRDKYLNASGKTANISQLLFGEDTGHLVEQAMYWYKRLEPFLESPDETPSPPRGEGVLVHFPTSAPMPDFLIEHASLDIRFLGGNLLAQAHDITHQPRILGRPAILKVSKRQLFTTEDIKIEAVFDHVDAKNSSDRIDFSFNHMPIRNRVLSKAEAMPLTLSHADSSYNGFIELRGQALSGRLDGDFSAARFTSSARQGLAAELAMALRRIDHFTLDADLSGKLGKPRLKLHSDLDKQLNSLLNSRLKERQQQLAADIEKRLREKVDRSLAEHGRSLSELDQLKRDFQARDGQLQSMLNTRLEQFRGDMDQQLNEAADELKKKLKIRF